MDIPQEGVGTPVTLTISAAKAVRDIVTSKNLQGYALRLYLTGGGCSGYQYNLALDNRNRAEDTVFETDGVKLIVDEVSIKYLQGASVDYVESADASGLTIDNPNPMASCNCGQSSDTSSDDPANTCASCG